MDISLSSYIKYCLGYIKLTRQRSFVAQQKYSVDIPKKFLSLDGLLNGDTDGSLGEKIDLDLFYKLDPKDVEKDDEKEYKKQKDLANKIEEIYNKYRNNPFTKQIVCNFGYFEIEIPISEEELSLPEEDENGEAKTQKLSKIDRYPLFSLPIDIIKDKDVYWVYFNDPEIQVNINVLEDILGEDLYYQLAEEIGQQELEGELSLPITKIDIFTKIWHGIKSKLKLKEARFEEKSFKLEEIKITLSPRANYFLAEDLQKLTKLSDKELVGTSLTTWSGDEGLDGESDTPKEKELFFPFLYDKYQLKSLSIIKNKASIIQGPPGTGKSETIANLLSHLAATGNRVLFVSQKAQALKVVKDKLKKLNVSYLFGYLPNPSSAQLTEEDEVDGIAPQLAALEAHIQKLGYKYYPRRKLLEYEGDDEEHKDISIDKIVEQKHKFKHTFNEIIAIQRKAFKIDESIRELKDYDLEIADFQSFKANFSEEAFNDIKELQKKVIYTLSEIQKYSRNANKKELDKLFIKIDLSKFNCSSFLGEIYKDVSKSGYDRHINLFRKVNNTIRNLRLVKSRSQLPREVIYVVDGYLNQNISRNESAQLLSRLIDHCKYYENKELLSKFKKQLEETLVKLSIGNEQLEIIDKLVVQSSFRAVKENILKIWELKNELLYLTEDKADINKISSNIQKTNISQRQQVAFYIQNIINKNIIEKWQKGITIKQIINKLSKAFGKSKKAYKTFDNIRKDPDNFNAILDLIPVWIMELDDASRIIPLEACIFDYVILDEASQCNIAYTLPVMFRAKHSLFVGDSEQMRDSTIMFKSNRAFDELARKYQIPEELQIKATGSAVQSVLDIAKMRGITSVPLQYHYRSPKELIGFSNKYFYVPKGKELIALNNNYLTYKDTNKILLTHLVEVNSKDEISDNVNVAEAEAILELFNELRQDSRYRDKSIGILSFFNAQATYLREFFEENGYKEEDDNYKISIVEGIQGDEKDIILYSFVIRNAESDQKRKYIALTGEGGDIKADINQGRVNVAFSRARQQVHCFVSMPPNKFPEGIWLKKYLEYVEENGEVDFFKTELEDFDSYFEKEFYSLIKSKLPKNFIIQNQVRSCGFKVDFVITNAGNGKKLAVECDGPCHFKDELDEEMSIYVETDEERQAVLEAAGWDFYRIKYSDWINPDFSKEGILKDLIKLLN